MVPNIQPPQFISRGAFNTVSNPQVPLGSADLTRLILAVLPIFLDLQFSAQPSDGFQANLVNLSDSVPSDEKSPLAPGDEAPEPSQKSLQILAKLIANGIAMDKFSWSQNVHKTDSKNINTEAKEDSAELKTAQNDSKNVPQPKNSAESENDSSTIFNKLIENLGDSVLKTPSKDQISPQKTNDSPNKKENSQAQNEKGNEIKEGNSQHLNKHEWRLLKNLDLNMQKTFAPLQTQSQEKKSEAVISNPSSDTNQQHHKNPEPSVPILKSEAEPNIPYHKSDEPSKISDIHSRKSSDSQVSKQGHGEKEIKPRADTIPMFNKKEEAPPSSKVPSNFPIEQLPISPEQPFSREGILRYAKQNQNTKLQQYGAYRFGDMILMVFCAVLCGAKNSVEVCRYLEQRENFFKVWLGLKNRIPPFRLFWFLLNRLNPAHLHSLVKTVLCQKSSDLALHVHVWESSRGLILGELNTLMPHQLNLLEDILHTFALENSVITIDAPIILPSLCRQIKRDRGQFILTLREEQGSFYEKTNDFFETGSSEKNTEIYKHALEESHQFDLREVRVVDDISLLGFEEELPYINSAVKLFSESISHNQRSTLTRCYLSSLSAKPELISKTLRILNGLEAKAQWLADCDFIFDNALVEFEKDNVALLQQMTANLIAINPTSAGSLEFN